MAQWRRRGPLVAARYNCELYNETGGSHRTSGISWAEGAEVHISLEACEAEFFINGTRIQHKATGTARLSARASASTATVSR